MEMERFKAGIGLALITLDQYKGYYTVLNWIEVCNTIDADDINPLENQSVKCLETN